MTKTIFVLGGYGGTGRVVCRRILSETDANVIVAGRTIEKAKAVADVLAKEFSADRVQAVQADASDANDVTRKLTGATMLLVASNTPQFAPQMVKVAIQAGVDYLDYHFNNDVPEKLRVLKKDIVAHKRIVISQAGFHPGLPATFARYGAQFFDEYKEAYVGMIMNAPIENPDSILELVDELQHPTGELFEKGAWRNSKLTDTRWFNLGRFGKKQCVPLKMVEMREVTDLYPLTDAGVYISGFNWCTDYFIFPFAFVVGKMFPKLSRRPLAKLLAWGVNTFPPKEEGVFFTLDAKGMSQGKEKSVHVAADCKDAYDFTAMCVVSCVKQYLDGTMNEPGIHLMGTTVDPVKVFADLQSMGVHITENIN